MSVDIENLDDLKALLKASKLNINDVEDLQRLLSAINANYNPDAARVKVAKRIGVVVPCVALVMAAGVSCFVVWGGGLSEKSPWALASLAVMWGVAGVVTILCTIFSSLTLMVRKPAAEARPAARPGPLASAFNDRATNVMLPENR